MTRPKVDTVILVNQKRRTLLMKTLCEVKGKDFEEKDYENENER